MGARTGLGNTDGSDNVFLGHDAGCKSTTGSNNVFFDIVLEIAILEVAM